MTDSAGVERSTLIRAFLDARDSGDTVSSYRRIGAAWWPRWLTETGEPPWTAPWAVIHLRRDASGWGARVTGFEGATFLLPDLSACREISC